MSEAARISAFGTEVRKAFGRFKMEEQVIRSDQLKRVEAGSAPVGVDIESMLERPTRRFLIDPMLRALDWDPDDPYRITEEARSWAESSDRLYFDYLGRNNRRAPILLVEAKGSDAEAVRRPHGMTVSGAEMAKLISEALGPLKAGSRSSVVLAQWTSWLCDLRSYVRSLSPVDQSTLKRVVITSGQWLIVYTNPTAAFIDEGAPDPGSIHCYVSLDDIVDRYAEIYRLLARRRLTDTLPLTLKLGEALQVLEPIAVSEAYRGVVVATRISGGVRGEYPTRAVYPTVVVISGGRAFAVVDYNTEPLEEPRSADNLAAFLTHLARKGDAFERRVLKAIGRLDLRPLPLDRYPVTIREPEIAAAFAAAPDSTAILAAAAPQRPELVRHTGERNADHEFLVITGEAWFYKTATPFGASCNFHSFPDARARGVAGVAGHFDRVANAFSVSGDPQHCEHSDLHGMRAERCQVDHIESHLCCRTCVFHNICWGLNELPRLPCAT